MAGQIATHGAGAATKAPVSLEKDTDLVRPQSIQDQMYLEACYIYLSSEFSAEMATRLKKMIRMGGGIQVTDYQPSEVTHVVVPSNILYSRLVHGRPKFNCLASTNEHLCINFC